MTTNSIIRYLLADSISLHDYIWGKVPSFKDVIRRLLLLLRSEDKNVPDHYYRLNQRYSLKDIDSLPSLLTKGLYKLAEEHLEMINDHISRLEKGECSLSSSSVFINLVSNLERAGDHLHLIAHKIVDGF